ALCHHCTVLRGGKVTGEVDPREHSNASLSRLMIGAEPPALTHRPANPGAVVLELQGLSLPQLDPFGTTLHDITLAVRAGEIVGVGARRAQGLHFVPEERLGRGAVPTMSLSHNTLLTRTELVGRGGWLRTGAVATLAQSLIGRFNVKAGGSAAVAKSLSGGNLQKFIVGREIDAAPKLLIVSQPTWGVDVGAAAQIRGELLKLRDAGCALLIVSEELDELFEISDRLVVIAKGRLSPSMPVAQATVEQVGIWMSGLWPGAPGAEGAAEQEVAHAAA
ncbi:MAG: ABC transporter, partial [Burkholderiales bacterium PBB5]